MFKTQATIIGVKSFKGDVEGQQYDSTTLYALIPMDESRGTSKGFGAVEYKWGDSTNFEKIKHLKFPLEAELTVEFQTSGRTQKTVVTNIAPLIAPQKQGA